MAVQRGPCHVGAPRDRIDGDRARAARAQQRRRGIEQSRPRSRGPRVGDALARPSCLRHPNPEPRLLVLHRDCSLEKYSTRDGGALASSDQAIDPSVATLTERPGLGADVAALGVLLVISSLVTLNAALPLGCSRRDGDALYLGGGRQHTASPECCCLQVRSEIDTGAAAHSRRAAIFEITAVNPVDGPASIENDDDELRCIPGLLEEVRHAARQRGRARCLTSSRVSATPAFLDQVRAMVDAPVLGIAQAAMHAGRAAGRGSFSGWSPRCRATVPRGMGELAKDYTPAQCLGVYATDIPVLQIDSDPTTVVPIGDACARALADDGSRAIVLGCAAMAPFGHDRCPNDPLGVPVVDGVVAATVLAEAAARRRTASPGSRRSDDELGGAMADHDDGRVWSAAGDVGNIEPSTTHSPSTPWTRHRASTVASPPTPHRHGAGQVLRCRPGPDPTCLSPC